MRILPPPAVCEFVGPQYRIIIGVLPLVAFCSYAFLVIGVAFFVRERFLLEIIVGLILLVVTPLLW